MDKTLLFIVNPRAGKTKSSAPLFDAVATFGRAGYLVRVMLTQAAGDAARFAAQWGGDYDLVVCAGGDGTLNETLSGLMQLENRPPVGYLPNGSTNDFAASLRIPSSVQQAARAVVEGTPHPLDLGAHNDRYFSYVASFGAFTKASYSASQETKNALGHFAYILEGIKNLDSLRPYRCRVEADVEQDVLYIAQVERHGKNGNIGKAFMGGFRIRGGAMASSVGHDNHNIIVLGDSFEDMALAVNRCAELGGGQVIVRNGEIAAEVAYPVCGLLSDLSLDELADKKKELNRVAHEMGTEIAIPFMFLSFICLAAIPAYAITDCGFIDVVKQQVVDPILEVVE